MRISDWSSDVYSTDLIFRRLIVENDCPTGFFSLAVYNADTVCQPECGLIFACRTGEISILVSGGIYQRAATDGANIIPAVASAQIHRQLIGDLVSDLAIKFGRASCRDRVC